jgi:hypothetical protein
MLLRLPHDDVKERKREGGKSESEERTKENEERGREKMYEVRLAGEGPDDFARAVFVLRDND